MRQGNVFTRVCHSVHRHPPGRQTPPQPGQADTPSGQTPIGQTPPPQVTATAVDFTHPIGMHSF